MSRAAVPTWSRLALPPRSYRPAGKGKRRDRAGHLIVDLDVAAADQHAEPAHEIDALLPQHLGVFGVITVVGRLVPPPHDLNPWRTVRADIDGVARGAMLDKFPRFGPPMTSA